jgi:hypothetical protein
VAADAPALASASRSSLATATSVADHDFGLGQELSCWAAARGDAPAPLSRDYLAKAAAGLIKASTGEPDVGTDPRPTANEDVR